MNVIPVNSDEYYQKMVRINRLETAFKELHEIACSQIDAEGWEQMREVCERVDFDHDGMDWKEIE